MAAEVLVESVIEHHGYESQRCAALSESAHANILVLRQRIEKAGALLPGAVAATASVYSRAGACAVSERNRYGAESLLKHSGAVLEMPRHWRCGSRQKRDRAELPAGEGTPQAGL